MANSLAKLAGEKAPQAVAAIGAWAMKHGGAPPVNRYNIWVNYNDLTTSSLEIMVSKGNHPQMALIQVSEL